MASTLTARYIAATIQSLPADSQEDVRTELTASIADAIEARTDQGEEPEKAERDVLTELGDPVALAAGYADRPLHLLGPRYYLTWRRLLRLLLAIVPACAVGGVALGQALAEAPVGTIISQSISVGITATVHLFFWTTLVFVVLDRSGAENADSWSIDQLPEERTAGTGRADLVASLVFLGLGVGAILWDALRGFVRADGEALPILDPTLWPVLITVLFAVIALEAVQAVLLYRRRRWDTQLAVTNTVIAVVFVSWALTLLVGGGLVNPAFVQGVFVDNGVDAETLRVLGLVLGFGIVGVSIWDVIDGWVKTHRDAKRTVAA
jgi:hypothetical protein